MNMNTTPKGESMKDRLSRIRVLVDDWNANKEAHSRCDAANVIEEVTEVLEEVDSSSPEPDCSENCMKHETCRNKGGDSSSAPDSTDPYSFRKEGCTCERKDERNIISSGCPVHHPKDPSPKRCTCSGGSSLPCRYCSDKHHGDTPETECCPVHDMFVCRKKKKKTPKCDCDAIGPDFHKQSCPVYRAKKKAKLPSQRIRKILTKNLMDSGEVFHPEPLAEAILDYLDSEAK